MEKDMIGVSRVTVKVEADSEEEAARAWHVLSTRRSGPCVVGGFTHICGTGTLDDLLAIAHVESKEGLTLERVAVCERVPDEGPAALHIAGQAEPEEAQMAWNLG